MLVTCDYANPLDSTRQTRKDLNHSQLLNMLDVGVKRIHLVFDTGNDLSYVIFLMADGGGIEIGAGYGGDLIARPFDGGSDENS